MIQEFLFKIVVTPLFNMSRNTVELNSELSTTEQPLAEDIDTHLVDTAMHMY